MRAVAILLGAALLASCGVTEGDVLVGVDAGGPYDAATADVMVHDAGLLDASAPDGTAVDAAAEADACAGDDLTSDPLNCGRCGHDCLGGACVSGACGPVLLATGPNTQALSINTTRVFWANVTVGDGGVLSVDKYGAHPITIATGQSQPEATWADDANVFWTDSAAGTVWQADVDGGAAVMLANDETSVFSIVADASNAYSIDVNGGKIYAVPRGGLPDGGAPTVVAPSGTYAWGLAQDAANLYWVDQGGYPVMASTPPGTIMTCPKDGSAAPTQLAGGQIDPKFLAVDATGVYWTDEAAGTVLRLAAGATTPEVVIANLEEPYGIAIDADYVYASTIGTDQSDGTVVRAPKDGSAPATVMASGLSWPSELAVDDVAVYWANQEGGSVMKVAK